MLGRKSLRLATSLWTSRVSDCGVCVVFVARVLVPVFPCVLPVCCAAVSLPGLRIAEVADNHDRHITYEDLKILKSIGSGCSSTVKLALHK